MKPILVLLCLCYLRTTLCGELVANLVSTNVTLKWYTDYNTQTVHFSIWFGKRTPNLVFVGISNNGDFKNNDGFLYNRLSQSIDDVYVDNDLEIRRDIAQNLDVLKIDSHRVVFERKLVTCDPKDYAFEVGTTQFIIAAGIHSEKLTNFNDKRWIYEKRFGKVIDVSSGISSVSYEAKLSADKDTTRFVINSLTKDPIPAEETTYQCVIEKIPFNTIDNKYHIVKMEPYITKGNEHLVHHMEIFLCQDDVPAWTGNCNDPSKPKKSKSCSHVIAAWAMGEGPIYYPSEAGLPLGGRGRDEYVMVEIHYNNPDKYQGVHDNSGFRFYITSNLRQYDAGIMELGLIYSDSNSIPPQQKAWPMKGYCPSQCTRNLPEDGINIFSSQLHAHLTGRKLWTSHYRNGVKIGEINRDEHYSPHWQHLQSVTPYAKILPNDELVTTCVYDTMDRTNVTFGGYGIRDEMCVNYIYYFPASDIEVCKSAISNTTLRQHFAKWHHQKNAETPISELYNSVKGWTPDHAHDLFTTLTVGNLNMHCLKGDGEKHEFISSDKRQSWENMMKPNIFGGTFHKTRDTFECPALNDLF